MDKPIITQEDPRDDSWAYVKHLNYLAGYFNRAAECARYDKFDGPANAERDGEPYPQTSLYDVLTTSYQITPVLPETLEVLLQVLTEAVCQIYFAGKRARKSWPEDITRHLPRHLPQKPAAK